MTKKNLFFGVASLLLLILAGAGTAAAVQKAQENTQNISQAEITPEESEPESSVSESATETQALTEPETEPLSAPSFESVALSLPEIDKQEAVLTVEAEYADYSSNLYLENERDDFSEEGYISGFSDPETDSIHAAFMIPSSQHYDITICVCADTPVTNALYLNDEKIGDFTIDETQHFVRVTFHGIWIDAGQIDVSLRTIDGNFSVDYFEISNNTELYQIKYRNHYDLSDENASPNAQKLMKYLSQNYGKAILTGQYASSDKNTELNQIYTTTGKYPAIRFGDMRCYSNHTNAEKQDIIPACERWANQGGIVGLIWHWDAPADVPGIYADETNFSLSDAVPDFDVQTTALMTEEQISTALQNNQISDACAEILRDIDSISEALKPLAENDIPVLWRPLHEAGGGWYWWGADGAQAYRWLWDVMYKRMTEYHQLHNLIWVWNGQSESYLVNQYDIASLDIYLHPDENFNSRYEQFVSLYRMTKHKKILALSEAGTLPDMNLMFRDNTVWSFAGLWYDEYLSDIDSELLINFYNSEKALTLDDVRNILK